MARSLANFLREFAAPVSIQIHRWNGFGQIDRDKWSSLRGYEEPTPYELLSQQQV
jgi:hypothetical protein